MGVLGRKLSKEDECRKKKRSKRKKGRKKGHEDIKT